MIAAALLRALDTIKDFTVFGRPMLGKPLSGVYLLAILLLGTLHATPSLGEETGRDDKIRAAYLYNIAKFIEWPDTSPLNQLPTINICTQASPAFVEYIRKLEAQSLHGKPIRIQPLSEGDEDTTAGCHLIYMAGPGTHARRFDKLPTQGNVTIGDGREFLNHGGLIAMVITNGTIRLAINHRKSRDAGIKMSANLLEVAFIVND